MPPFNDICRKTEDAIKGVLDALKDQYTTGVEVRTGFQRGEINLPRVNILCERAVAENVDGIIFTGNWNVSFDVAVLTNYIDESRTQRELKAAEIFDIILDDEFVNNMNTIADVSDFHAYGDGTNQSELGLVEEEVIRIEQDGILFEALSGTIRCRPKS